MQASRPYQHQGNAKGCLRKRCTHQDQLPSFRRKWRLRSTTRGKGFACWIADDLQFEQIVCRPSSCSRSGGQRVAVLSSMPSRFSRICRGVRWRWGHRKNTTITFGSSTKAEGVLCAVHPTSFPGTFKHPQETNANWKSGGECELYAPEKKCVRRAAILVHDGGAREVRAVRIILFRLNIMAYDACSMCTVSI